MNRQLVGGVLSFGSTKEEKLLLQNKERRGKHLTEIITGADGTVYHLWSDGTYTKAREGHRAS